MDFFKSEYDLGKEFQLSWVQNCYVNDRDCENKIIKFGHVFEPNKVELQA